MKFAGGGFASKLFNKKILTQKIDSNFLKLKMFKK